METSEKKQQQHQVLENPTGEKRRRRIQRMSQHSWILSISFQHFPFAVFNSHCPFNESSMHYVHSLQWKHRWELFHWMKITETRIGQSIVNVLFQIIITVIIYWPLVNKDKITNGMKLSAQAQTKTHRETHKYTTVNVH